MNFIPQMSPIYWMYISLYCYLNYMLLMMLINSLYIDMKVNLKSKKIKYMSWKWFW